MDSAERADYRISIHAPRTGSDLSRNAFWICAKNFNPRSPHGERQTGSENHLRDTTFQSTLPARGATGANVGNMRTSKKFQSTLPARGATASCSAESCLPRYFNPRSPHGERLTGSRYFSFSAYFNPRSPHGERLRSENNVNIRVLFQSTLPARGATTDFSYMGIADSISIHAPRTGSDAGANAGALGTGDFNPRSPHGERRRGAVCNDILCRYFNPRSPHGERRPYGRSRR